MHHLKDLWLLAWPILISQLLQTSIATVDTLMAGRASVVDLAGVGFGSSLWLPFYLLMTGILTIVTAEISRLKGAGLFHQAPSLFAQSLSAALLLSLPMSLAFYLSVHWLDWLVDLPADSYAVATEYLVGIALAFPAGALFIAIKSVVEGSGVSRYSMEAAFLGLLVNIPANYALIYGEWGFPELGGAGCGWATALTMWVMVFYYVWRMRSLPRFADLREGLRLAWPQVGTLKLLAFKGGPLGLAILLEASLFLLIAFFVAHLGNDVLAANQITMSYTSLLYMFPLSFSIAVTILVARAYGEGDFALLHARVRIANRFAIAMGLSIALLTLLSADWVIAQFTLDAQVAAIAWVLFMLAASYQVSDALQITFAAALKGVQDTQIIATFTLLAYLLIGFPTGYLLAFHAELLGLASLGVTGFWVGIVIGLSAAALLFGARLWFQLHTLPEPKKGLF